MVNAALGRGRLVFAACLLIAAYFLYSAVSGAVQSHRLTNERDRVRDDVAILESQKRYLEGVRDYVASDAYVEQQARRQLGYVRDGEIAYVVVGPPLEQASEPTGEWWQRLFPQ
jgi:cell division protein FtsB